MNLVMDDAIEIYLKKDFKRQIGQFKFKLYLGVPYSYLSLLGRILLRGDNITLIMQAEPPQ